MMASSGFEKTVAITRFFMKITAVWPKSNPTWCLRFQLVFIISFMVFFINIPQTKMMFACDNMNDILKILITADINIGLASFKLLGAWLNKQGRMFKNLKTEILISSKVKYNIKLFI